MSARRSRLYLAYLPPAIVLVRKRRDLGLPVVLSAVVAWSVPVAMARGMPGGQRRRWRLGLPRQVGPSRQRARAAAVWAAQMWAYKVSFEMPYDHPERLYRRLHIDLPIAVDRRLGLGMPPGERLQRRLRRPPRLNWLDRALTVFYTTWELEPHAALAWILLRHPERFASAAVRLAAAFDSTLVGYWLVPTAPPWWASEREGRMGRAIRRVNAEVIRSLRGEGRPSVDHNPGSNPWASMPSDHFGAAAATAMLVSEIDSRAGAAAWAYALFLGLALVYLGEHYVADLLAGLALATLIDVAGEPLARPVGRLLTELGGGA